MMFYEDIFRDFQKERVRYVLVGGIAFNLLGGVRSTQDMDILLDLTDNNLAKVVRILQRKGFQVRQPVDPMGIADKATRRDWIHNKNMKPFNFCHPKDYRQVDIIIESPVSYREARKDVKMVRAGDIRLPVIGIDHLIKMKRRAGRSVDKYDIDELGKIKRLRKKT